MAENIDAHTELAPLLSTPQPTSQVIPSISSLSSALFSSTTKLSEGNYTVWKGQLLTTLIVGGYEDFILGDT